MIKNEKDLKIKEERVELWENGNKNQKDKNKINDKINEIDFPNKKSKNINENQTKEEIKKQTLIIKESEENNTKKEITKNTKENQEQNESDFILAYYHNVHGETIKFFI